MPKRDRAAYMRKYRAKRSPKHKVENDSPIPIATPKDVADEIQLRWPRNPIQELCTEMMQRKHGVDE